MAKGTSVLSGTVKGPDGKPIAGAIVSVHAADSTTIEASSTTDERGRYRLEYLVQKRPYILAVEVAGGKQDVKQLVLRKRVHKEDISLPIGGPTMTGTTTTATTTETDTTTASDTATASDSTTASGTTATGTTATGTTATGTTATGTTATGTTATGTTATGTTATGTTVTASGTTATTATGSSSTTTTVAPGSNAGAFDDLIELIERPDLAPEPRVNAREAFELARMFVIAMYLLAGVPAAVRRLQTVGDARYQMGDLTLARMGAALPADTRQLMERVGTLSTENIYTEEAMWQEIRSGLNLGTAATPSVNGEMASLYRELVRLAADDRAVDPEQVATDDPRQRAEIYNFLRDLKRAIVRITQNMSVYGTTGNTVFLIDKWSRVVLDSLEVLNRIATQNVESEDSDDMYVWSLLAAATDTPRGTVKGYIVNARNGGELLRLAVAIYDAVQAARIPSSGAGGIGPGQGDLDREDDEFLRSLFFAQGSDIFLEPLKSKIGTTQVAVALRKDGGLLRDYVAQLWP